MGLDLSSNSVAGLVLLFILIAGYAVQLGGTCAVAAVRELLWERRPDQFLSFFACGMSALAVMSVAAFLGHDMFNNYHGATNLTRPLAGGAIFGAGAWLNGRCAFGTIARLGSGEASRLATVGGFLVGFSSAVRIGIDSPATNSPSPLIGMSPLLLLFAAGSLFVLLWIAAGRRRLPVAGGGWHPFPALALIGVVNGVLLVLAAGWPYTNLLMDLAHAKGMALAWRSLMSIVFILGSVIGAIAMGRFRPRAGNPSFWARCFAGGTLMGIGATLVPGGNDTMLLIGLPLLLPSFAIAYVAMIAILILLTALGGASATAPTVAATP